MLSLILPVVQDAFFIESPLLEAGHIPCSVFECGVAEFIAALELVATTDVPLWRLEATGSGAAETPICRAEAPHRSAKAAATSASTRGSRIDLSEEQQDEEESGR
jgi:hypothetical protein